MKSPEFSIDVPSQCENCPTVAKLREEYAAVQQGQEGAFDALSGDNLPEQARQMIKMLEPDVPDEMVDELIRSQLPMAMGAMRQQATPFFDQMADKKLALQARADALAEDCPGRSSMRAKDKLGRTVTARICSSPKANTGLEAVYIERQA